MKEILKVLVGSQAHGLAGPDSDYDYRAVFVEPTTEILKLGGSTKTTNWIEGKEDNTSWELAHFLNMAVHCNPTILEVFLAPREPAKVVRDYDLGDQLRDLFPHVWNSKAVMDAFIGYGLNQRKKFLENKDNRRAKYAVAYLRTLYQAAELINTGTFHVKVTDFEDKYVTNKLIQWKAGHFELGEVVQVCEDMKEWVEFAYKKNPDKKTNLEPVNEFLLKVRKEFWNE